MYFEWKPYVPVAVKLAKARKYAERQAKKEKRELSPVKLTGRKLATKFWGQAWCDNLDHYSDFANRLPRGRTYLGNGSVVDLQINAGRITAIVAGSEVYAVSITIKSLAAKTWKSLRQECSQSIHSLLDLLQGRFDEGVMRRLAQRDGGLFPQPKEIEMECSCPDYARVCKHIAAVIYGVGTRLDISPELLFTLRNVDHSELITQAVAAENLEQTLQVESSALAGNDLGELFGINLESRLQDDTPAASQVIAPTKRKVRAAKSTKTNANEQRQPLPRVPARKPAASAKRRAAASAPIRKKGRSAK